MNIRKKRQLNYKRVASLLIAIGLIIAVYSVCFAQEQDFGKQNVEAAPNKEVPNIGNQNNENQNEEETKNEDKEEGLVRNADSSKVVYMTFDDGPHNATPVLLDMLDKYNVKATFFVTAQFLNDQALTKHIKEISNRGHAIAVHTYSHNYENIYSSVDAYISDYQKMDDIIFKATGKRSEIFRFPGGSNTGYNKDIREDLINEVNQLGLTYYDWNAYNGDCDGYTGQALIDRAVSESSYTDKSILLMHDVPGKETVVKSLPSIIEQLWALGYRFDSLDSSVEAIQFT